MKCPVRFLNQRVRTLVFILLCLSLVTAPIAVIAQTQRVVVAIEGIDGEMLNNVKMLLSIEQQKSNMTLLDSRIRRLHRRAGEEIAKALRPYGYYSPQIDADLRKIENQWHATYRITPGAPVTIKELQIVIEGEGKNDPEFVQLIAAFPLKRGDPLRHDLYEKGKRDLLRSALDSGYLDATLERHNVTVDIASLSANIELLLSTQQQYHLGNVNFQGGLLDKDFLEGYIPFEPGDHLTTRRLLDLQTALYDSDYFASAEVHMLREQAVDNQVPIEVVLSPRKKYRYSAGAGYGTDTGARWSLGWENRRVNSRGHRFGTTYKGSEVTDSFDATYTIPIRDPRTDRVEVTTSWLDDTSGDTENETWLYGLSRTISRHAGWLETIYLHYREDSFVAGEDVGKSSFLVPGITWSRVKLNETDFIQKGRRLSLDIKGAHEELVSDSRFVQITARGKLIAGLGDNTRFILRGEVGATRLGDFHELPPALRYFAGGDQSVRGYAYRSLSPDNAGGEQLLVGGFEVEQRVAEKWGIAAFIDAGNAMNEWSTDLYQGAGLGLRWYSPIGPLRVDVAQALSLADRPYRLHITIGPVL